MLPVIVLNSCIEVVVGVLTILQSQTQTKLVIMTTVKTTFVSVIIVLHMLPVTSLIDQFGPY